MRLLGPVDVLVGGAARPVRGQRRKAVLAILGLHPGEAVSTGRLVDLVWGDAAPPNAVNALQSHVSYLRRTLDDKAAVTARPPGYLLDTGTDGTDVAVAERLIAAGLHAAGPATRARHLQAALELWRGAPLADAGGLPWLDEQAERLGQLWLRGRRALIEARLDLGQHADLLPDLEQLTREHPFDEQLHGQLILALYRLGRQADALAAFRRLRRTLHDDLGIEPGAAVRDLESAILRQDPDLDAPPAADGPLEPAGAAPAAGPVPAQLPLTVPTFAGRAGELADLDQLLTGEREVAVAAVTGTAGVGKSALVVHWAHRAAGQFPDGQLYVNLRGFDPGGRPVEVSDALRGFLDAFGVAAARVPADVAAQAALLRSLLAGRRVLIVLDNARDAGQVRPLLPGAPGCLTVVTSRDALGSLVALEGALPVTVGLLSDGEAGDLLIRRLGAARVAAEPAAVAEIVTRCARLPLALAVVAGRAATRPELPLADLAGSLRAAGTLDAIAGDDPVSDPRAVFSWSYRALRPAAAELLRRLSLAPGPDLGADAIASLAGGPAAAAGASRGRIEVDGRAAADSDASPRPARRAAPDRPGPGAGPTPVTPGHNTGNQARPARPDHSPGPARRAAPDRPGPGAAPRLAPAPTSMQPLAELLRANLVAEPAPGRFCLHDLLHAYAAEQAAVHDAAPGYRLAVHRLLDHYLHTADAAARLLDPTRTGEPLTGPQPGTVVSRLATRDEALAWFDTERRPLLSAVHLAAEAGLDAHTWQLADATTTYLDRRGRWHDLTATQEAALRARRRAGDRAGLGDAACALGRTYARIGRHEDAEHHLGAAMWIHEQFGDAAGLARAGHHLGWLAHDLRRYPEALALTGRALRLFDRLGDRLWRARALNATGWIHGRLGEHREALQRCREALTETIALDDRHGEAGAWDAVGHAHQHLGDPRQAIACYGHALRAYRELGDCSGEAGVLAHLADAHDAAADPVTAADHRRRARSILAALNPAP
ncbi:BTAD domain-containing putative transcriptional regulator [Dactylosporangium cerinum]|uniref:BTAD domain-containing putative transcriptional regulator n=1 Tax=Dactylosporangium cerinum TaxID=1434730 RepID=A0ABV9WJ17_9ACTN